MGAQRELIRLHEILAHDFDEEELRTLCFGLAIDYDDLKGEGKRGKARELVALLDRHGRIGELVSTGKQLRPDVAWDGDAAIPPARSPVAPKLMNVPRPISALVGREADLETLEKWLCDPDKRLITLTGPGGIGKTRLAIAAAQRVQPFFRDGVCYVSLAAVSNPDLVAQTIAQSLKIKEEPGVPIEASISARLYDQSLLLVPDNFEQVLDAAKRIAVLVVDTPELHVLVTSRERLHIIGEQRFDVGPLPVPEIGSSPSLPALTENPAVALFIQRARENQAQFPLTMDNVSVIVNICAKLEGIPLAIELVAAQLKAFLRPSDILAQLDQFMLTADDSALDRTQRQKTMGDTIAWSHSLLTSSEKILFATLAVFSGGCFLEAVKAICTMEEQENVYEILQSLIDKSLVQSSIFDGEPGRLTMLEVILAFARERLNERPDADLLRQRHAEFFQQLAERATQALNGSDQKRWMDHLDSDQGNLREAMRWLLEHQQALTALRLAGALWRFWYNRGYLSEGRRQIQQALAQVRIDLAQGTLRSNRETNAAQARALDGLGSLAQKQGDYNESIRCYEEALVYYRQIEDKQEIAETLSRLGVATMHAGDENRARQLIEASLALNKGLQNILGAARAHNNLGMLAHYQSDHNAARHHYMQSLVYLRELGDEINIAIGQGNVGEVAFMQGDLVEAQHNFAESLAMCDRLDDPEGIAFCIDWLAQIAVSQADVLHAARLWGAARALRYATGVRIPAADYAALTERITAARAQSEAKAWDTAWAEGQQLSQEQAVALALNPPTS